MNEQLTDRLADLVDACEELDQLTEAFHLAVRKRTMALRSARAAGASVAQLRLVTALEPTMIYRLIVGVCCNSVAQEVASG